MIIDTGSSRLELRRGDVVRLELTAGAAISCSAGSIWVTRDTDPADVVLEAGGKVGFDGAGVVLVQALEDARVAVVETEAAPLRLPVRAPLRLAPANGRLLASSVWPMAA